MVTQSASSVNESCPSFATSAKKIVGSSVLLLENVVMDSMNALIVWMFPFALDFQDDFPRFVNWQQYRTKEVGGASGI
jgi:hypothetical protein